jgi:hypothetical protein
MADVLFDALENVRDESTFVVFVRELIADRTRSARLPTDLDGHRGEWANESIEQFLEAATSWADDSQFGSRPGPKPENPWKLFAMFLWAGRGYE